MPKTKITEEDESYLNPEPRKYRKYSRQTKLKYCYMVKQLRMRPSSVAKLLKIRNSTAKMFMKKYQSRLNQKQDDPNDDCHIQFRNGNSSIKSEQQNQQKINLENSLLYNGNNEQYYFITPMMGNYVFLEQGLQAFFFYGMPAEKAQQE